LVAISLVRLMSILLLVSLPTLTTKITEPTHGVELCSSPVHAWPACA
jgi:hypothetical protein